MSGRARSCARLAGALAVLAWAAVAFGQGARAVLGDASSGEPSHAWVVLPEGDGGGVRLIHLPPRAGVERAGEPGTVRGVRELKRAPAGVAAVGDRVYLLFEGAGARTVLSGRALEAVGGLWAFEPADRLVAHASPPAGGDVLGFAGTAGGPALLLGDEDGARVLVLRDGAWEAFDAPGDGGRAVGLLSWEGSPAVVLASGSIRALSVDGGAWSAVAEGGEGFGVGASVFGAGALAVEVRVTGGSAAVRSADASGVQELGAQEGLAGVVAITPVGPVPGTVAMLWREPGEAGAFRIVERSVASGRVVYDGEPRQVVPVTAGEFQLLTSVLVVLTIAVIVIAVKPMPAGEPVLPEGTALAEPGRRLAATTADGLVAVAIVSWAFGVSVGDVVSLRVVFEPHGWAAVPAVLGVGAIIGTACEAAFGRTLGKVLMGCRVVRFGGAGGRPGVGRCLVRNLIKWVLPPVPALALLEPAAPHRGDVLSGLVVVVGLAPGEEAP